MVLRLHSVTFDCSDPGGLAAFWAGVTGYRTGTVNPFFAELGGDGSVGPRMMFIKVEEAKAAKPDIHLGICGEHGGDPESVWFCERLGLDYVSCSPRRVPTARLAAGQAIMGEAQSSAN